MNALYALSYLGHAGGVGCLYLGNGMVVGIDASGGRFHGTYRGDAGRIQVSMMLIAPPGGTILVTGGTLGGGQAIPLTADWPPGFADGTAQQILVMGRPVQVTLEKIADIP